MCDVLLLLYAILHARAMLSFIKFTHLTYCKEGLINFLMQHGVLASTIKCHKCNNDVYIDKETLLYRCRKWYLIKNVHNKRAPCNVILREVLRLVLGSIEVILTLQQFAKLLHVF